MSRYRFWYYPLPCPQLSLTDLFKHTVGYSKNCESGLVCKSKVEGLGDTVLTPGLAAGLILSRSLISYLSKEAVLELS